MVKISISSSSSLLCGELNLVSISKEGTPRSIVSDFASYSINLLTFKVGSKVNPKSPPNIYL
jgi:hypothetical protein